MTPPELKQANCSKPFILRTVSSIYTLGAILLERDDKTNEYPIEYVSKLLTVSERYYSNTEREALVVVWAIENVHEKLNVVTDMLSLPIFDTKINNRENYNFANVDLPEALVELV
ncbi:hypothetical protein CDAR_310621 [Caerostris darwini]|uniref:Reverse transcriptase/retrotransposon-derived protein RNase H-like domain-containing protein n=1 Tax=Caerostris darwini TaxID=1538125 RepID=A0AAV4WST7_9ARAC|nr:hypothetical protein CDAR_310621 [Caerostris darwini]